MKKKMGRPTLFSEKMVDRTFRISAKQDNILSNVANKNHISKNALIRELITEHLLRNIK